jgi:hypothetical protein
MVVSPFFHPSLLLSRMKGAAAVIPPHHSTIVIELLRGESRIFHRSYTMKVLASVWTWYFAGVVSRRKQKNNLSKCTVPEVWCPHPSCTNLGTPSMLLEIPVMTNRPESTHLKNNASIHIVCCYLKLKACESNFLFHSFAVTIIIFWWRDRQHSH